MDMVKGLDCPLYLSIEQWADVLRCLKKHHSDPKAISMLELGLREELNQAVNRYKDHLRFELFEAEGDDLEETQDGDILEGIDPAMLEEGIALGEEEPVEPMKFAAIDVGLFGGLCSLFVGAVWAVTAF